MIHTKSTMVEFHYNNKDHHIVGLYNHIYEQLDKKRLNICKRLEYKK